MVGVEIIVGHLVGDYVMQNDWMASNKKTGSWPCLVHCALYTLSMWAAVSMAHQDVAAWPLWAWSVIFGTHFVFDRFGLAFKMMDQMTGQRSFAEHLAPWSVIIVDNTWHILIAFAVACVLSS